MARRRWRPVRAFTEENERFAADSKQLFTIGQIRPTSLTRLNGSVRLVRPAQGPQVAMYQVLTCLTTEHDWRLVLLAGSICFLPSTVAFSRFDRARASQRNARLVWVALDAAVSGCGIWATHFI